jgi:acyl-CoA thioester hydrolase
MVFEFPLRVRYMEVDAQGVVFNGWYLTYFDEALAEFLRATGTGYAELITMGLDTQLVHAELDWKAGLRWRDEFRVAVSVAKVGQTSFTLDFEARRAGEVTCTARIVYVVVATDGSGKRPVPSALRGALGEAAPMALEGRARVASRG